MIPAASVEPRVAALLLAGGRSIRMGRDKAMLDWQGQPLWRHQVEKLISLKPQRLVIACRQEQLLHDQPGLPSCLEWCFDPPGQDLGPLGAIQRVLAGASEPCWVVAVDLPHLQLAQLQMLAQSALRSGQACFFRTSHGLEPLAALYHPSLLPFVERSIAQGQLAVKGVAHAAIEAGLAQLVVLPPDLDPSFHNMNRPEDYPAFE